MATAKRKHSIQTLTRNTACKKYSETCQRVVAAQGNHSLPLSTRRAIDLVNKYLEKPFILKSLNRLASKTSNQQARVRDRIRKVIITLLSYMTWSNRYIGIAKRDVFDTVCHDVFIETHEKIHGEKIAKRTWERDIRRLKDAGYIDTKPILSVSEHSVRGETCPKWFTDKIFLELGFQVAELSQWAERSFNKLLKAGLTNEWPVFTPKTRPGSQQAEFAFPAATYDDVPDQYAEGFGWDFDHDTPLTT